MVEGSIVQERIVSDARDYAASFQSARPFRHIVIDDFLGPQFCRRLLQEFPLFDASHAVNEQRGVGGKATFENVRELGPTFVALDEHIRSSEFLQMIEAMTGIPDLLYDPDYVGGGTHENLCGQELDPHVDFNYHPTQLWHRRLNLIVFLNPEWDATWGGAIELHTNPWKSEENQAVAFLPVLNRCIIFETTEASWHGFKRIELSSDKRHLSRRSFAIYLYSRTRPSEDAAASHATVYVERPLPERFRVGSTLTYDDVEELKRLLARRDQHLRRLYDRELKFSDTMYRLTQRLEHAQGLLRQRLPIQGCGHQVGEAEGIWDDLWVSADLRVGIQADREGVRMRIVGYVPDTFPVDRELILVIGEQRYTRRIDHGVFEWAVPVSIAAGARSLVRVTTSGAWNPSQAGVSGDDRDLAFQLVRVVVE